MTTQGLTREAALDTPDEAVVLHDGETGREPTDEDLRAVGIDTADTVTGTVEPPDGLD